MLTVDTSTAFPVAVYVSEYINMSTCTHIRIFSGNIGGDLPGTVYAK